MKAVKNWKLGPRSKDAPIATDFSSESNTLLIAFGGLKGGIGRILPFEFFNLTKDIDTKKIYVRDLSLAWYHRGLPKVAKNIDGIAKHLKGLINKSGAAKVVCVGNSAGGYAALLFGHLVGANTVLAFAPQTFISKRERQVHKDTRWEGNQIRNAHGSPTKQEKYFNLKRVLGGRTKYHIYYQRKSRLDKIHAERMKVIKNISLHSHDEGGGDHYLVVHLKKSGKLKRILENALK